MTYQDAGTNRFETRNDLRAAVRVAVVDLLNARVADATDLYAQTKQAHWNVKGSDFIQLHLLFDDLASHVLGHIDLLAERATSLGGEALGTVRMAADASSLPEFPRDAYDGMDAVDALADRYAAFGAAVRADAKRADQLGDLDTTDVLVEVSRGIDKDLWFLEAHLQKAR
jgi:starvation-inducible DNA-binding protein